jgi:hypothetical protein
VRFSGRTGRERERERERDLKKEGRKEGRKSNLVLVDDVNV